MVAHQEIVQAVVVVTNLVARGVAHTALVVTAVMVKIVQVAVVLVLNAVALVVNHQAIVVLVVNHVVETSVLVMQAIHHHGLRVNGKIPQARDRSEVKGTRAEVLSNDMKGLPGCWRAFFVRLLWGRVVDEIQGFSWEREICRRMSSTPLVLWVKCFIIKGKLILGCLIK